MAGPARPRVFLDSNVIFSALHSPSGPPAQILRLHIEGRIRAVVSRQVLDELVGSIAAKLPHAVAEVQRLLVSAPPEVVPDPSLGAARQWTHLVDSVDAPIIAAADEAGVDCFVTGDRGFLQKAGEIAENGIVVLSPRELLDQLK